MGPPKPKPHLHGDEGSPRGIGRGGVDRVERAFPADSGWGSTEQPRLQHPGEPRTRATRGPSAVESPDGRAGRCPGSTWGLVGSRGVAVVGEEPPRFFCLGKGSPPSFLTDPSPAGSPPLATPDLCEVMQRDQQWTCALVTSIRATGRSLAFRDCWPLPEHSRVEGEGPGLASVSQAQKLV